MKTISRVPTSIFVCLALLLGLIALAGIGASSQRVTILSGNAYAQDATTVVVQDQAPGAVAVLPDGDTVIVPAVAAPVTPPVVAVVSPASSLGETNAANKVGVIAGVGVLISLLLSLLRSPLFGGVLNLLPAQYRVFVPLVIGILTALGSLFGGVADPQTSALLALSGPAAVSFHEVVGESLLGGTKSRSRGKKNS